MVYQAYGGTGNSNSMSSDQNRKIFLGGLNYHTTDETLRAFCSHFGKITDCLVMRNGEGKSRGFGFVTYEDTTSVEEFMRSRPHTIDNRQIDPKRAMPREEQNSTEAHLTVKKLFVAGLREGINEEHLRQHFSRFGHVMEVIIMKDRDGKPRGFAFVTFDDYDAVDKAVLEKPHMVNDRPLDVKKAVPKEKMHETGAGNQGGMPSYNKSNYQNAGPAGGSSRNNYGSMRDDYGNPSGSWDNQAGMHRMGNPNVNYNQPPVSMYDQQGGYSSPGSGYNQPMQAPNLYQQSYNQMGQGQPVPPPPPPSSMSQNQQPSSAMMNYDLYSKTSSMPYNNNPNASSSATTVAAAQNYMQPPVSSYAQSSPQNYGASMGSYGSMSNPFGVPQPGTNPGQGGAAAPTGASAYSSMPPAASSYDNPGSYGITASSYGATNYNNMPPQQSRGGGPMRGGRGGGASGNYGGPSSSEGAYGNRPAPYPARGNRGGRGGPNGNYGGRGRGRGN